MARLQRDPGTTVTAREPGLLYGLDRDDFLAVVTGHPRTAQLANAVADRYAGPRLVPPDTREVTETEVDEAPPHHT